MFFTDKNCSQYTVNNPTDFLSIKALQRRKKQGIKITGKDLPVCGHYINDINELNNITLLNTSKWFNAISIKIDDPLVLNNIIQLPYVYSIKPVKKYSRQDTPYSASAKHHTFHPLIEKNNYCYDYGEGFNPAHMIHADFLHNYGHTGNGITIAVFDGGFWSTDNHEFFDKLYIEKRILGTKDFVQNDKEVYESSSHGTQVLSCMAAFQEGVLVGTAPDASYYLFKTEDVTAEYQMEEDFWVAAAEYADSIGVDIINSSLGYTTFDDTTENHSYSDLDGNTTMITRAADIAASKGILVCNSAGNSGDKSWFHISAPADGDSVLAVGAVNPDGEYLEFSSKGPSFDGRIKPNVAAQGNGVKVAASGGGLIWGSGTSFACPILAGAAACLWQVDTTLTNMELMQVIEESANQFNNPDSLTGYGIPDFKIAYEAITGKKGFGSNRADSLKIYPNPVKDWINIDYFSTDTTQIEIHLFDLSGKEILVEERFISCERNLLGIYTGGWLQEGVYVLSLTHKNKKRYAKFLKSN